MESDRNSGYPTHRVGFQAGELAAAGQQLGDQPVAVGAGPGGVPAAASRLGLCTSAALMAASLSEGRPQLVFVVVM
jgi:hypothetical protein